MRVLLCLLILSSISYGQRIHLNHGETLIAINGIPIEQIPNYPSQVSNFSIPSNHSSISGFYCSDLGCGKVNSIASSNNPIINKDPVAFAHAQREANIIASMGANYYRMEGGGHPLGVAPGCRYSGTGYTWDPNRPGHCYENELPESRIVARARARGINGAWFWSAHYK